MLNFTKYRAIIAKIQAEIEVGKSERDMLMRDGSRNENWYLEQIGRVKEETTAEIQELFQEMQSELVKDLNDSKPKELGDFQERMYKSQAVAQEISDLQPEQLRQYFSKLVEYDDQVKLREAFRLIDTKFEYMSGSEDMHSRFRREAFAVLPEFRNYEATKGAIQALESGLPVTQSFADLALSDAMNAGDDYSSDLVGSAFDGAIANAERASQI